MLRDPALQDLSRDHHTILLLAQRLRRDAAVPEAVLGGLRSQVPLLLLHFQEEESLVYLNLPTEEAARLKGQHDGFRADFRELGLTGTLPSERLARMGEALRSHVRDEETAFDRLQRALGRSQMGALGEALQEFRRRHRPSAIGPGSGDFPSLGPACPV